MPSISKTNLLLQFAYYFVSLVALKFSIYFSFWPLYLFISNLAAERSMLRQSCS